MRGFSQSDRVYAITRVDKVHKWSPPHIISALGDTTMADSDATASIEAKSKGFLASLLVIIALMIQRMC
jgi:hypothetical protein